MQPLTNISRSRAQESSAAIEKLYITMRHLFNRGFYKPMGVSGDTLREALLSLRPEIYGSIAEDKADLAAELGLHLLSTEARKYRKPLDMIDAFRGNNDDDFIYGIVVKAEGAVITPDYERADIVVASPTVLVKLLKPSAKLEAVDIKKFLNIALIPKNNQTTRARMTLMTITHWSFFRGTSHAYLVAHGFPPGTANLLCAGVARLARHYNTSI